MGIFAMLCIASGREEGKQRKREKSARCFGEKALHRGSGRES